MLNNKGFDLWADGYDEDVWIVDEDNEYPFAGYKNILGHIYSTIMRKPNAIVLDVGFGTGTLATKLYEKGYTIYGQDFSSRMIELAYKKMPNANLYEGDFTNGLVEPLQKNTYDFIVATYSIHHLSDNQKIHFLKELCNSLSYDGKILIGDVAFETREDLDECRKKCGIYWDDEEYYCVASELRKEFPSLTFDKMSFCSGILTISK